MAEQIDYGQLMHRAMRGLIRQVLQQVAEDGRLPGEHHFFITISTGSPGVQMAPWLHDRYPEEMTIVIQHWFENLVVDDEGFAITLNFGNSPEPMYIPFDAVSTFVDPSVEFGLRFETQLTESDDDEEAAGDGAESADSEAAAPQEAEIVSLDKFRK